MAHEHPGFLELTNRVRRLEQRVNVLSSIANYEKYPFTVTILEYNMDIDQEDKTLALINKAEHSINTSKLITFSQFEKELWDIVPSQRVNPEFTKDIVRALHERDKQSRLYDHFKKQNKDI